MMTTREQQRPGQLGDPLARDDDRLAVQAGDLVVHAERHPGIADPVDGTRPAVNIGTMVSGGITPFMHPETMTAIIEVRVIEGMTREDVPNELRSALLQAGPDARVEVTTIP